MELNQGNYYANGPNGFANQFPNQTALIPAGQFQSGVLENTHNGNYARAALCPHKEPPGPAHTCFHPYHAVYSETHLPLILFRLDPPDQENKTEITFLVENDRYMIDHAGRPIRDFPFLPRYISTRPPAWLMEYWMRTDSRLTYRDIKARMNINEQLPSDNVLNMRREREARLLLGLSCWTARRGDITKAEVERVERLTADQVAFNTTMTVEYGTLSDGRRAPAALLSKSIKSPVTHRYPLQTFVNGDRETHIPSPRLNSAIELLFLLQDTAATLGIESWKDLPPKHLPSAWHRKGPQNKNISKDEHGPSSNRSSTKNAEPKSQSIKRQTTHLTHTGNNTNVMKVDNDIDGVFNSSYPEIATPATQVYTPPDFSQTHPTNTPVTPHGELFETPVMDTDHGSRIAIAALSRIEPSVKHAPDSPPSCNERAKEIPIDPRLFDCRSTDVDGPAKGTIGTVDPSAIQFNRYNSGEPGINLRSNNSHCVHRNTAHVMNRNNPFEDLQQPSVTTQRSFERYLLEDATDDQSLY